MELNLNQKAIFYAENKFHFSIRMKNDLFHLNLKAKSTKWGDIEVKMFLI